jgi:hypothetical protein
MTTSLYVIRARDAPVAVIFRKGPTKQVRMIRWAMRVGRRADAFQRGQWLAGRVYPERSDLSPDGSLLVYFGMRRGHTWSALCRPPWFTPLAAWDELGTYGGGGVFVANDDLRLRTNPASGLRLDAEHALPSWLRLGWHDGRGVAEVRDLWSPEDGRERKLHPFTREIGLVRTPVVAAHGGVFRFSVVDTKNDLTHDVGICSWADWDPTGALVFAREGAISRIDLVERRLTKPIVLAEFSTETFERIAPSAWAREWPR